MRNTLFPTLVVLAATTLAHAQTATVTTLANGAASTTIAPGESVSIRVRIAHNQSILAGIQGGTVITDNAGSATNFATALPGLPTVQLGGFVGGSRVGADIASTPPGFIVGYLPGVFGDNPLTLWEYEITDLSPGVYHINWVSPATAPNVRLYAGVASFSFLEAQTTYTGATITVIPTPQTLAPLIAALALTPRRRRTAQPTEGAR